MSTVEESSKPPNKTSRRDDFTPSMELSKESKVELCQPINKMSRRGSDYWSMIAIDKIDIKTGKVLQVDWPPPGLCFHSSHEYLDCMVASFLFSYHQTFGSPKEAALGSSVDKDMIINCVRGAVLTAGGFGWVETGTGGSSVVSVSSKKPSPSSKGRKLWPKTTVMNVEGEEGEGEEDDDTPYCSCRQPSTGRMISCDNPQCTVVWYHDRCVGFTYGQIPPQKWFCPTCFQQAKEAIFKAAKISSSPVPVPVPILMKRSRGNSDDISTSSSSIVQAHGSPIVTMSVDGDVDGHGDYVNNTKKVVIKKKRSIPAPAPTTLPVPVPVPVPVPFVFPTDFPTDRMEKVKDFFALLMARKHTAVATIEAITKLQNQAMNLEKAVFEGRVKEDLVRARFFAPSAGAIEPATTSTTREIAAPVPPAPTVVVAASRPSKCSSSSSAAAAISISTSSSPSSSPPSSPSSLAASTQDIISTIHLPPPAIPTSNIALVSVPSIVSAPVPVQSVVSPAPVSVSVAASGSVPGSVPTHTRVTLTPEERLAILAEIKQMLLARLSVRYINNAELLSQLDDQAKRIEKAVFDGTVYMEQVLMMLAYQYQPHSTHIYPNPIKDCTHRINIYPYPITFTSIQVRSRFG